MSRIAFFESVMASVFLLATSLLFSSFATRIKAGFPIPLAQTHKESSRSLLLNSLMLFSLVAGMLLIHLLPREWIFQSSLRQLLVLSVFALLVLLVFYLLAQATMIDTANYETLRTQLLPSMIRDAPPYSAWPKPLRKSYWQATLLSFASSLALLSSPLVLAIQAFPSLFSYILLAEDLAILVVLCLGWFNQFRWLRE